MFRTFPKFSVAKFLNYNQVCSRNVGHTLNCQGVFPSILRKSIIQAWRPMFGSSVNPPAKYVDTEEESYYEKLLSKLGLNCQCKTLIVNSTLNILNKYAKQIEKSEINPSKGRKISFNTAGRFRKFIGDKSFTYFGTDGILSCSCKRSGDDPCKAQKKRKNAKKKMGGSCPYIKEECRKGGHRSARDGGGGSKKKECKKLTSDPCGAGKKGKKKGCSKSIPCKSKSSSGKKSDPCKRMADVCKSKKSKSKKRSSSCTKSVPCKAKGGSDSKKSKQCSKAVACNKGKSKGGKREGGRSTCASRASSCKKGGAGKSKAGGQRPTCPAVDNSCKKSGSKSTCRHDTCGGRASKSSSRANCKQKGCGDGRKGDLCKQERGDPCKRVKKGGSSKSKKGSGRCESRGDPCSKKKKPRCD